MHESGEESDTKHFGCVELTHEATSSQEHNPDECSGCSDGAGKLITLRPPGCFHSSSTKEMYFNVANSTGAQCN